MANSCPYCWPQKRNIHWLRKIDYYISRVLSTPFASGPREKQVYAPTRDPFTVPLMEILSVIGLVQFTKEPNESEMRNRSLIFFKEAKRRGLDIEGVRFLSQQINDFRLRYNGRVYYFEGIPLTIDHQCYYLDNKIAMKRFFQEHGIPVARGEMFSSAKKGFEYGKALGFPLVTKPNSGSLSRHVIVNIQNEEELRRGIEIAQIYRPDFVVEQFIPGKVYRATVVGRSHVFVCEKERANVTGDGKATVRELIEAKNADPMRGEIHQKNATLYKIPFDERLDAELKKQNLTQDSVLKRGQKIYVQEKYHSCDIIACTEETHPENRALFLKIAELLQTDLVGIDFIAPDIGQPHTEQITGVLETNSLPYIDMHRFPSHGKADPVEAIVWDLVLAKLDRR